MIPTRIAPDAIASFCAMMLMVKSSISSIPVGLFAILGTITIIAMYRDIAMITGRRLSASKSIFIYITRTKF
ncbi:MAG: hypothetical protein CL494_07410 [Actinobacteria bacterium]|nr:hypothetical protein [Actinomycetota bacterium]